MHKFKYKLRGLMNKPISKSGKKTAGDLTVLGNVSQRPHSLLRAAASSIVRGSADGIVIVDKRGRIRFVNEQTENLFGYRGHDLVGKPIEVLMPERVRRVHMEHRTNNVADPRTRLMGSGLDLVGRRKDGSEFPLEISLTPLKIKGGLFVTCIIRDITERERVERESLERVYASRQRWPSSVKTLWWVPSFTS